MIRLLPWVLVAPLFAVPLVTAFVVGLSHDGPVAIFSSASLRASLGFSFASAFASTLLSVVIALPGAWLLGRHRFRFRRLFVALTSLPFVYPPILFACGFLRFFGNNGLLASALRWVFPGQHIDVYFAYSFEGIVFAQALMNFPLVMGMVSSSVRRLDPKTLDAARLLGARGFRIASRIVAPQLVRSVLAAATMVFLYCFMSFSIPLILGGGPQQATLEVSIYAALNSSQNFAQASAIATLEVLISVTVLVIYGVLTRSKGKRITMFEGELQVIPRGGPRRWTTFYLCVTGVLALLPFLGLVISSFTHIEGWSGRAAPSLASWFALVGQPNLMRAFGNSLLLSMVVALLSVLLAGLVVFTQGSKSATGLRSVFFSLPLALSPVIMSLAYLVLFPHGSGIAMLAAIQASFAYPLAARLLASGLDDIPKNITDASKLLSSRGAARFFRIEAALLRPYLLSALALCAAISLGEINSVIVLNPPDFPVLSLSAYRLMGSYQYPLACAAGVLIGAISLGLFAFADAFKEGRRA